MQHAMTRLAQSASNVANGPATKLDYQKRIATLDDKMVGSTLASEIMAAAKLEANIWRSFAIRIMNVTSEARVAMLNAIKGDKGAMTKGQTEFGIDDKLAKKRTNSATTRVSEMQSFANAWNSGASVTGLLAYANALLPKDKQANSEDEILAHAGYTLMLEYARTFSKSKAGRPSKTWTEKLIKFLEDNAAPEDKAELAIYNAVVKLVDRLLLQEQDSTATPF